MDGQLGWQLLRDRLACLPACLPAPRAVGLRRSLRNDMTRTEPVSLIPDLQFAIVLLVVWVLRPQSCRTW
jgi:hypothetical protein